MVLYEPQTGDRTIGPLQLAASGCSRSTLTSATRHLPRIDRVDGRYLSADGA